MTLTQVSPAEGGTWRSSMPLAMPMHGSREVVHDRGSIARADNAAVAGLSVSAATALTSIDRTASPYGELSKAAMVEVVHLHSNLLPGLQTMVQLRVKATASQRSGKQLPYRQSQIRLNPQQANALATAYRAGKETTELAAQFGIHRATVTAVLQRLGVEPRRYGLSDEQVAEACRLYPEGWSLARLGERYNVIEVG
jgi:hypothetical protein